jgi:hypothetical protein
MPRITDTEVSALNDAIAHAATSKAAFDLIKSCSRTMLGRLLDLNGEDVAMVGLGQNGQAVMGQAHGWHWAEQDDDRPADGYGPCADGFDRHSRRPLQCRFCNRRRIDHRPVVGLSRVG